MTFRDAIITFQIERTNIKIRKCSNHDILFFRLDLLLNERNESVFSHGIIWTNKAWTVSIFDPPTGCLKIKLNLQRNLGVHIVFFTYAFLHIPQDVTESQVYQGEANDISPARIRNLLPQLFVLPMSLRSREIPCPPQLKEISVQNQTPPRLT